MDQSSLKAKMTSKSILPFLIIGGAVVAGIALSSFGPTSIPETTPVKFPAVEFQVVSPANVSIPVFTRGVVEPRTQIELTSVVNGPVQEISPSFNNGGYFNKGDWLVKIDAAEYRSQVARATADFAAADLHNTTTRAKLRSKRSIQVEGISRTTDLARGKPQLQEAAAKLYAAETNLQTAKEQLANTTVKAPFTGRVQRALVEVGEYAATGKPIAQIYATDFAQVRLPLSSRQLELVNVPMLYEKDSSAEEGPIVILQDTHHKYSWQGRLVRSEGNIDPRNRLIYTVAEVKDPYVRDPKNPDRPPLASGSFVEAMIQGKTHENIVVLPRSAIYNNNEVWVINQEDRLERNIVEILYRGKNNVYVNKGLQRDQRVVVTPLDIAVNNMRVEVTGRVQAPVAIVPSALLDQSIDTPVDKPEASNE